MRLEQIPLFIGVVVAIVGLGLVLDAQLPEGMSPSRERRRRERAERHRGGETLVGIGVVAMAAALIGSDAWRFGTVSVLVGLVLLCVGGWLNRQYLRESVLFRGAARRGEKRVTRRGQDAQGIPSATPGRAPVRIAPGLADSPPPREPGAVRGDREAPIMTAADVPKRGRPLGDDTPPEPRLRIR
jgi:hypothetical protein